MSEETHLSRRQLREQGKLTVRDPSTPSLTETEELRLRRPSRRELREAERANKEAEDRIRNSAVHPPVSDDTYSSVAPVPEQRRDAQQQPSSIGVTRQSVFAADGSGFASDHDQDKFTPPTHVVADDQPHEAQSPEQSPTHTAQFRSFFSDFKNQTAPEGAEPEQSDAHSREADNKPVHEPSPGLKSQESQESQPLFQPGLQRTSVFSRFDDESLDEEPRDTSESIDSAVSMPAMPAPACDTQDSLSDRFVKRTSADTANGLSNGLSAPEENSREEDSEATLYDSQSEKPDNQQLDQREDSSERPDHSPSEESLKESSEQSESVQSVKSQKDEKDDQKPEKSQPKKRKKHRRDAGDVDEEEVTVSAEEHSSWLNILVMLILIIIGALIGYLIGTWMWATFWSAPESLFDGIRTAVLKI